MVNVIGVRFKPAGKTYYFDPLDFDIKQGDSVIVETSRGIEYGEVVMSKKAIDNDQFKKPLKGVIRIATEEDTEKSKRNRELEKEAYKICLEKIQNHKLEMKLVEVEYTFDGNKILFYFTADGRIDFRELVKTWLWSLRQELNFVKSASEMRRKLSEVSVYAAEVYVAVSSSVSSLRCL